MDNQKIFKKILVIGGAGHVGSMLIPKLIKEGYYVRVLDLFLYSLSEKLGEDIFGKLVNNKDLELLKGDIRDDKLIERAVEGVDAIIHLACISNDPSFDLDPKLGKSINYLAFFPFLEAINKHRIKRLIYASSGSVYGVKEEKEVTEDLPIDPLTDYALYKAFCEKAISDHAGEDTEWVILRPATACGYAPRMRLDLCVNILTNHAVNKGLISVFGGSQYRPNIHIEDMTDVYLDMLKHKKEKIDKKIFNVGEENLSMMEIAKLVQEIVGGGVEIVTTPTDDLRSYRLSGRKIKEELGWAPKRSIKEAVESLVKAFKAGKIKDPLDNPIYYNIMMMQKINLK